MDKLIDLKLWQQTQRQQLTHNQHLITNQSKTNVNHNQLSTICEENITTDHLNSDFHIIIHKKCAQFPQLISSEKEANITSDYMSRCAVTSMDSSPVTPGIDGRNIKTFEDLLNKTLANEPNISDINANIACKPKQPYLRKGEGLKRYCSRISDDIVINKSNQLNSRKLKTMAKSNSNEAKQTLRNISKPNGRQNKFISNTNRLTEKSLKNCDNDKQPIKTKFNRKVIALTTKCDTKPCVKNNIIITRNNNNQSKDVITNSNLCTDSPKNLSNNYNNIDIDVLQTLLKKVEQKKRRMQKKIDDNDYWTDISDNENQHKKSKKFNSRLKTRIKKVRWNRNVNIETKPKFTNCIELDEPKFGAYSLAMKNQISLLENRLSELRLQCAQNKQSLTNSCDTELNSTSISVLQSIKEVNKQMETLNKRLMNIETRAYDLGVKNNLEYNNKTIKHSMLKPNSSHYVKKHNENSCVTKHENYTNIEFTNGDRLKITDDNTMLYRYSNGVTQTTYSDGLKIINFPNGQIEKTHKNGVKHITYSNGSQRIINIDGSEEVFTEDGTMLRIHKDGTEYIEFKNGDREIRTDRYKRREYRNGTIKTLYTDGTEETRYNNGRLRIKDVSGKVIVDSHVKHLNVE